MSNFDRRRFLNLWAGAAAATLVVKESAAADLPRVPPGDPTAAALGYVEDATKVDSQKYPQHQASQRCATCQQFQKQPGSPYGPCTIFSGKSVSERGWCAAYSAKA